MFAQVMVLIGKDVNIVYVPARHPGDGFAEVGRNHTMSQKEKVGRKSATPLFYRAGEASVNVRFMFFFAFPNSPHNLLSTKHHPTQATDPQRSKRSHLRHLFSTQSLAE